jgi:hypothetical protein
VRAAGETPRARVVGFTGHRHLQDTVRIATTIRTELEAWRNQRRGSIAGYASIAIGADTLFVEACLALEIPWTASLPFSADEFQKDFPESEWSHATMLLIRATAVDVCVCR